MKENMTEPERRRFNELNRIAGKYGPMHDDVQEHHDEYVRLQEKASLDLNPDLKVEYFEFTINNSGGGEDWWGEPCSSAGEAVSEFGRNCVVNRPDKMRTDDSKDYTFIMAVAINRVDDERIAELEEMGEEINEYSDEEGDHVLGYKLLNEGRWHKTREGMFKELRQLREKKK